MGAKTLQGLIEEMNKRARDGWRVVSVYAGGNAALTHFVVFERTNPQ